MTILDKAREGPIDPLNNKNSTISEFFNALGITLHVELRNNHIL